MVVNQTAWKNPCNEHNETNKFLAFLAFNSFLTLILQPTRIISHSNTVTDNIFSNVIDPEHWEHS